VRNQFSSDPCECVRPTWSFHNDGSGWDTRPTGSVVCTEVSHSMQVVRAKPTSDVADSKQVGSLHENQFRAVGVIALGLLGFTLHFAEMWVTMLLGTAAFGYASHGLAIVGDRSFLDPVSLQSEVGHGIFMTAPMVLWMRIRGCHWRENIEMALGMIVPWAAVLTLGKFGLLQELPWISDRNAMAAGMLAVMLYHTWAKRFPPIPSEGRTN
jgi:hypothetical protein